MEGQDDEDPTVEQTIKRFTIFLSFILFFLKVKNYDFFISLKKILLKDCISRMLFLFGN
jgi:hypothetical protein